MGHMLLKEMSFWTCDQMLVSKVIMPFFSFDTFSELYSLQWRLKQFIGLYCHAILGRGTEVRDGVNKDFFYGSRSGGAHLIKNVGVYLGRIMTFVIPGCEGSATWLQAPCPHNLGTTDLFPDLFPDYLENGFGPTVYIIMMSIPSWLVCVLTLLAASPSLDPSSPCHFCDKEVTEIIASWFFAYCFLKLHCVMSYCAFLTSCPAMQLR